MPPPSADPSPPEFPAWSNTVQSIVNLPGLQGFIDSDLLQTYLNIKLEPPVMNGNLPEHMANLSENNSLTLMGGNKPDNDTVAHTHMPLNGGNSDDPNITYDMEAKGANIDRDAEQDNPSPEQSSPTNMPILIGNIEETASPVGLKKSCILSLMDSIPHTNSMSLFETCVDILSLNSEIHFTCSMVLPWSLTTGIRVLELQRIKYQPLLKPHLVDVILYDHVHVHPLIKNLWLKQVNTWKYSVPLSRLTAAEIKAWQPSANVNSWDNIDPYSCLEDIGMTSSDDEIQTNLGLDNVTININY